MESRGGGRGSACRRLCLLTLATPLPFVAASGSPPDWDTAATMSSELCAHSKHRPLAVGDGIYSRWSASATVNAGEPAPG